MAVVGLASLCSSAAFADLPQLRLEEPQLVLPKRIARISPDLKRVGPWIDYQGGIAGTACSRTISYDAFEPDIDDHDGDGITNEPGDGYYGLDCGAGGGRWLFTTYCDPFSVDDMTVQPGEEGRLTDRIEFTWSWSWCGIVPPCTESCLMVVFTTEDVAMTCAAPSAAGTFAGVIYDFGDLPSGFYYTDVDLCTAGLDHEMPNDGQGGNILIGASEFTGSAFILGLCNQPGLWGTKHSANILPGSGPHFQDVVHWDDCCPIDSSHDPAAECFSYGLGVCPDPLGWAVVFYGGDDGACDGFVCGDANCDSVFDGADIDTFFQLLGSNICDMLGCPAGVCPPCHCGPKRFCVADINGDQAVDGADIDAFFEALGVGHCP